MSRMTWTWQIVTIENKGFKAFEEGKKREDCPYTWGRTGFVRQRWDAWHRGFDLAAQIACDQRIFDRARAEGKGKP